MSLLEAQLSSHTAQLLSLNQQVANVEAKIVSLQKEKGNTCMDSRGITTAPIHPSKDYSI